MKVYKFGGASIKSAQSIIKLCNIITAENEKLILVFSAIGKTTNMLEQVFNKWFNNESFDEYLRNIENYHLEIIQSLFNDRTHNVYFTFREIFNNLIEFLDEKPSDNYNFEYDKIVSSGELLSTAVISEYFASINIQNKLIDIRNCIITNDNFRDAKVDWDTSHLEINKAFTFTDTNIYITQGFIASTKKGDTTTLGREGSDYSASIITYLLNAEEIVIWKDVDGIYNSDPKKNKNIIPLPEISYQEAIELTYFGAKVIHPKTIKPLQNKNIPLLVKSFDQADAAGTIIKNISKSISLPPITIIKENQILISVSPKDFSFIAEENLSKIFALFALTHVRINLSENSAISFSACMDYDERKIQILIDSLSNDYYVRYNKNLELITVRHYTEESLQNLTKNRKILIEQRSRLSAHFVIE